MQRVTRTIGIAALFGAVFVLVTSGVISLRLPFSVDVKEERRSVGASKDAPVEITRIEPITLDCRARIHATVPVEGKKEHRFAGQVYRTDSVTMHAIGDIDTCVDATKVEIVERADGQTVVIVPADAIQFVRPRVDADAMLGSVDYDKGLLGKFTDAFPWVSDSEGLTAAGYSFAQGMVGSSDCMEAAFDSTVQAITNAYRQQALSIGRSPASLRVDIVGEPNFDQAPPSALDSFDFEVNAASCQMAASTNPL